VKTNDLFFRLYFSIISLFVSGHFLKADCAPPSEWSRTYSHVVLRDLNHILTYVTGMERFVHGEVLESLTVYLEYLEQQHLETYGHCVRVAQRVFRLGQFVNAEIQKSGSAKFGRGTLKTHELVQLVLAGLLHDYGKLYLPREVLDKEKKLYPWEMAEIEKNVIKARLATDSVIDLALQDELRLKLEDILYFIKLLNDPEVSDSQRKMVMKYWNVWLTGIIINDVYYQILTPDQLDVLAFPYGTWSQEERKQFETHVQLSVDAVSEISWPDTFGELIPIISVHHEFLNGSGYPQGLTQEQIPFFGPLLTLMDIFDALRSSRSYKGPKTVQDTLKILRRMADKGEVDGRLLDILIQHLDEVYHW